ncbi:MAG: hypothetical protein R6V83_13945 [Candidatus Thorarchaeota archaeon]
MNLIDNYKKFCQYRRECRGRLDLSDESFLFPTTLLPLFDFIKRESPTLIPPKNENVAKYLTTVTNGSRFELAEQMNKSYLPIVSLPKGKTKTDRILKRLYDMHNDGQKCGGENAFKYLVGEIVDNIYEHSEFNNSIVMAQAYESSEFMDVSFFDDGITINGCFSKHGMGRNNDVDAIWDAINGISTKSKDRGYGLGTVIKIFTQGIEGEIFIISGKGGIDYRKEDLNFYSLNKPYELAGTLVTVRVPYPAPVVDIYGFIE